MGQQCTQGCFGCTFSNLSDHSEDHEHLTNSVFGASGPANIQEDIQSSVLKLSLIMFGVPLIVFGIGVFVFHSLTTELVSTNETLIVSANEYAQNLNIAWLILGLVFVTMFCMTRMWSRLVTIVDSNWINGSFDS